MTLSTATPGATIYYTLDGVDPRSPGGAIAPSASAYSAPLSLAGSVHVKARARDGTAWSAVIDAMLTPDVSLRVTELMYHPVDPPVGSPYEDDDFEFIEVANVGTAPLDLDGIRFSDGVDFQFGGGTLAAGARALLVRDQAAFESRYGSGLPVIGEYDGNLANEGERIRIETNDGEVLDFTYDDAWQPDTDGGGHSLVVVDAAGARAAWSRSTGWRSSSAAGGSPGGPEPALCTDGIDNDGDGAVDLVDPDCESASDDDETAPPIDAVVCYSVRADSGTSGATVSVGDEVDASRSFTLDGTEALCLPAVVDSDAVVVDAATHLQSLALRAADGASSPERHDLRVRGLGPSTSIRFSRTGCSPRQRSVMVRWCFLQRTMLMRSTTINVIV